MASKDIDIKLKLDAKQADKDLKGIKDDLDELDETTTVKVDADTDAAEDDLKTVDELSERLAKNDTVIDIKADIDAAKADLDQLETKLHGIDDAAATTGHKVGSEIGDGAGEARGRMSELVGESVAELPGIGEALGPAGEALSSLTESALAGEIAIGGLVGAAGGMIAITAAFKLISGFMEDIAKTKAWNADEVNDYAKAIREGQSALEHFNETFEETGKIEFIDDGDVKDASEAVDDLGLTVKDFTKFVANSTALDKYAAQFDGLRESTALYSKETAAGTVHTKAQAEANEEERAVLTDLDHMIEAVTSKRKNMTEAQEQAERVSRLLGVADAETARENAKLTAGMEKGTDSIDHNVTATDDLTNASKSLTTQLDKARQKTEELVSAERAAVDKKYAYRQATKDADDALANMNTTLGDHKATQEDVEAATDNARDAIIDQSAEYATLKGAALDSKDGIDRQIDSLTLTASTLAPGSPLRVQIDEYIKDLKNIPTNISTTLTVTQQSIIASGGQIPGFKGPQAEGGLFFPRPGGTNITVAEAGQPEIVAPWDQFLELLNRGAGSGGGGPVTVIQNFPPGISPLAVAKANKEYQRRGGRAA